MREWRATSLPTGTGFLANRLLVAALLAGGIAGFLVIANRIGDPAFSPRGEIDVALGAALATRLNIQTNVCERVTHEVAHGGLARVLRELIVA